MHDNVAVDKKGVGLPQYPHLRLRQNPNDMHQFYTRAHKRLVMSTKPTAVVLPGSTYNYDSNGFLTCIAPVNGAAQNVGPVCENMNTSHFDQFDFPCSCKSNEL